MYEKALPLLSNIPLTLVGSGNGIRKSGVLQKIFEEKFSLKMKIPKYSEEAARGAVVFSGFGTGIFASIDGAQAVLIKEE